jgi:hypothetical protein
MLHEFLSSNREELISRCRAKVSQRSAPGATALELEHGVPVFLDQLVSALRDEELNPARHAGISKAPASAKSRAGLHGKEMLQEGYTVDQVVHDYGDICQAITELAKLGNAPVTVDEFHTLNRLLDNAIADAVFSYAHHHERSAGDQDAEDLHQQLGTLADQQRELLDTALKALDALKVGNIGLMGATGTLLEDSLMKLRLLIDKSLPEIRLSSGMVTPPHS